MSILPGLVQHLRVLSRPSSFRVCKSLQTVKTLTPTDIHLPWCIDLFAQCNNLPSTEAAPCSFSELTHCCLQLCRDPFWFPALLPQMLTSLSWDGREGKSNRREGGKTPVHFLSHFCFGWKFNAGNLEKGIKIYSVPVIFWPASSFTPSCSQTVVIATLSFLFYHFVWSSPSLALVSIVCLSFFPSSFFLISLRIWSRNGNPFFLSTNPV